MTIKYVKFIYCICFFIWKDFAKEWRDVIYIWSLHNGANNRNILGVSSWRDANLRNVFGLLPALQINL